MPTGAEHDCGVVGVMHATGAASAAPPSEIPDPPSLVPVEPPPEPLELVAMEWDVDPRVVPAADDVDANRVLVPNPADADEGPVLVPGAPPLPPPALPLPLPPLDVAP